MKNLKMLDKIKKIFGIEKEANAPVEAGVNFNEIPDFIRKETKGKRALAADKINELLNEIMPEFEALEVKLIELKKSAPEIQAPVSKRFDPKPRDRFCDDAVSLIKKIKRPQIDRTSLFNFLNECDGVMKKFNELSPKSSAWIGFLFKEKMKELGSVVKNIQGLMVKIRGFIESDEAIIEIEANVNRIIKNIEEADKEISSSEKKLKVNEKEIEVLAGKIVAKKDEFSSLQKGTESGELKNLEEKIKIKRDDVMQIEQHISSVFSSTNRIMKKFRHLESESGKGVDKEFIRHLDFYLNSPTEAYVNEKTGGGYDIHKILSKINKAVEKKEIEASEKERDKWIHLMDIIEKGELMRYKENYMKINGEIRELESEYEKKNTPFVNKKDEIEKDIEKLNDNLSELKTRGKELENNINKFKSGIENNKCLLEKTVAYAVDNAEIKIIY